MEFTMKTCQALSFLKCLINKEKRVGTYSKLLILCTSGEIQPVNLLFATFLPALQHCKM